MGDMARAADGGRPIVPTSTVPTEPATPPTAADAGELSNLQMTRIRTSLGAGVEYALSAVHAEVTKLVLETVEDRIRLELEAAESWGRAQERRESASATSEPIGYEVLIFTNGRWSADWDGVLHPTLVEGRAAEAEARAAGWPCQLATLTGTPEDAR